MLGEAEQRQKFLSFISTGRRQIHPMTHQDYSRQHRGDRGAYERYLSGMDASMRQKVALTAAHILSEGRIADMGMGSGTGSEALAALYPALQVVGVDVNPEMVAIARDRYRLPNLEFVTGDIAEQVFEDASLDGILDSSVLHHVTTFNDYDFNQARRALENQIRQLRVGGALIVRDFLDPGPGEVLLDLPVNDGDESESSDAETDASISEVLRLSTAALFERFAREFRKLAPEPGFAYTRIAQLDASSPALRSGFARYRVQHKLAVEFVLRKDYRRDWDTEILEEYTYYSQAEFERIFSDLGLRVTASTPIRNPWIVRNRFENKFELRDLDGRPLEFPATNYLIVGEKVAPEDGVRFVEGARHAPINFLHLEHYRDVRNDTILDLVRRPGRTLDVIPWFFADDDCFILARKDYPRPIATLVTNTPDGRVLSGYVTEPLAVIQGDGPIGRTVEDALVHLAGIAPESILEFQRGSTYYPSPGGIEEEVCSTFVRTHPVFVETPLENQSGFNSAGQVRAIQALQLLRAAQVGGLPDARLELNVYHLLRILNRGAGPWIGETIVINPTRPPAAVTTLAELTANIAPRRAFRKSDAALSSTFLDLRCSEFSELNRAGEPIASQMREYGVPRPLSIFTFVAAVLRRDGDAIYLGIDDHDLPAAQAFNGNSNILVTPAWRLPREIRTITPAFAWIRERLRQEYGINVGGLWELGGPYMPSPGVTPELAYPIAVEVTAETAVARRLYWVNLNDFRENFTGLRDGHLRIVGLRAAHALGLLQ